jgi:hypothetical protein
MVKEMKSELENRYFVIKWKDLIEANVSREDINKLVEIGQKIEIVRAGQYKEPRKYVVIESDWPEYQPAVDSVLLRDAMDKYKKKYGKLPE